MRALRSVAIMMFALTGAALMGGPAAADPFLKLRSSFSDSKAKAASNAPSASYRTLGGGPDFVLDLTSNPPLLKLAGDREIYVLSAVPAPRGDVLYKYEDGAPAVNRAALGGLTLYSARQPDGWPALAVKPAPRLSFAPVDNDELAKIMASGATGTDKIGFSQDGPALSAQGPVEQAAFADAALVAQKAVSEIAAHPIGAEAVSDKIEKIVFRTTEEPALELRGRTLLIGIAPDQGPAGRPSSFAIRSYLKDRL